MFQNAHADHLFKVAGECGQGSRVRNVFQRKSNIFADDYETGGIQSDLKRKSAGKSAARN